LTNVTLPTILESSRTTYFDISQEYRNWIGRTLGRAKDHGSTWVTQKRNGESRGKRGLTTTRIRKGCNFLRRSADTANELKGSMSARATE